MPQVHRDSSFGVRKFDILVSINDIKLPAQNRNSSADEENANIEEKKRIVKKNGGK